VHFISPLESAGPGDACDGSVAPGAGRPPHLIACTARCTDMSALRLIRAYRGTPAYALRLRLLAASPHAALAERLRARR
jgi:hypothetical protein